LTLLSLFRLSTATVGHWTHIECQWGGGSRQSIRRPTCSVGWLTGYPRWPRRFCYSEWTFWPHLKGRESSNINTVYLICSLWSVKKWKN